MRNRIVVNQLCAQACVRAEPVVSGAAYATAAPLEDTSTRPNHGSGWPVGQRRGVLLCRGSRLRLQRPFAPALACEAAPDPIAWCVRVCVCCMDHAPRPHRICAVLLRLDRSALLASLQRLSAICVVLLPIDSTGEPPARIHHAISHHFRARRRAKYAKADKRCGPAPPRATRPAAPSWREK